MFTSCKSYRVLGFVATVMVALLVLAACGGGGDDEPEPTATSVPATATTVPATATTAPTATATTAPSDGNGGGAEPTATSVPSSGGNGGGTTSVQVEGVPLPEPFTGGEEVENTEQNIEMVAMGGSGQSGTARIVQIERTSKIELNLSPPGEGNQVAIIGRGRCADAERDPQVDYILFDVEDGESVSVINQPPVYFSFSRAIILVYNGDSLDSGEAACGNIFSAFG